MSSEPLRFRMDIGHPQMDNKQGVTHYPDKNGEWVRFVDVIKRIKELEAQQWQPIDSAPKDGTKILVCHEDKHGNKEVLAAHWGSGCWQTGFAFEGIRYTTHWMPLPSPPKEQSE